MNISDLTKISTAEISAERLDFETFQKVPEVIASGSELTFTGKPAPDKVKVVVKGLNHIYSISEADWTDKTTLKQ